MTSIPQISFSITDTANLLGLSRKKFITWLAQNRWIYKRPTGRGPWKPYADKISSGYLELSLIDLVDRGFAAPQTRITLSGIIKIKELMRQN